MSKRYDFVALGDMLDGAKEIEHILLGMDRDIFDMVRPYQLSVLHLLQTIGEAANRTGEECRREHPEIDWPNIIGLRNRISTNIATSISIESGRSQRSRCRS